MFRLHVYERSFMSAGGEGAGGGEVAGDFYKEVQDNCQPCLWNQNHVRQKMILLQLNHSVKLRSEHKQT